jgi:hypothetical protein
MNKLISVGGDLEKVLYVLKYINILKVLLKWILLFYESLNEY